VKDESRPKAALKDHPIAAENQHQDNPPTTSQQVSWSSVHEFISPLLKTVGTWPMIGTPAWCELAHDDPRRLAAIFDAAQHWALRMETSQQAACEASRDIAAAEDWSAIANAMFRREFRDRSRQLLHPAAGVVTDTPTVTREGARARVNLPLDSSYFTRLNQFGAHFDHATQRWWVSIAKANALEQLLTLPLGSSCDEPAPEPEQQRSAAALLVDMASEDYTLGVTDTKEPFGKHSDTPHVAMMLRGGRTGLRAQLAKHFWDACHLPAPQQAITDACLVLEGLAAQEDPRPVHLRVAQVDGAVYIDMSDAEGHVIEISGGQWYIENTAPVLFRRTKLTGEIPKPVAGGDLSQLWHFVPVAEEDRPLVLAWLVHAMISASTPHAVLEAVSARRCTGRRSGGDHHADGPQPPRS
jgi:hypothetical protein